MARAKWIWNPGDFELYHHMLLSCRRQEKGCDYPCAWHISRPEASARFRTRFTAARPGSFTVYARGRGMVRFGGRLWRVNDEPIPYAEGEHEVCVELCNTEAFPAIYVNSEALFTDGGWTVDPYDAVPVPAACEPAFYEKEDDPAVFPFACAPLTPVGREETQGGMLIDYGRETFGPVTVTLPEDAEALLVYGESREEALDPANALLWERLTSADTSPRPARAFRYLFLQGAAAAKAKVEASLEYLPISDRASFSADEPGLDAIWDTCARTFHLNTREFFLDGIKRDRWVWSGDAYQSYMIARYLYHDPSVTERTIVALLGKPPYRLHVNTINDYSAYLIVSVWEHFAASGRRAFLAQIWENLKALYAFIVSRLDERGFVVPRHGDWIFIDWGQLDKNGAHCFEQILLWRVYRCMALLGAEMGEPDTYTPLADALRARVIDTFWDEEKGAFIDSASSGKRFVSRQTNVFAVLYDFVDGAMRRSVIENALLNPDLPAITTPYFKLYELMALCKIGKIEQAQDYIASYWGGMLQAGATSVWEAYDPDEQGAEHYAMYGSAYGKSLCHAWGSGPILLLCRYCAGVEYLGPSAFRVSPRPGRYAAFNARVPVGEGEVTVEYRKPVITVRASVPGGLFFDGAAETPLAPDETYTFIL
ncbi:MAG: hypothetical protein IJL25_03505 [Clostridia bacterium]|nr:hypothetical protein [Clostridia bacterium]